MDERPRLSLHAHFAALSDPRIERSKRHALLDILTIALCAVIGGADSWVDVELFGHAKLPWLRRFLTLPNGIPSQDTFGRVVARLDPRQFERCFLAWVQAVMIHTDGEVVALDGNVLRRSHDQRAGRPAIDLVSAWADANRVVLGQLAGAPDSNEITTIPALLDLLALDGCIVTVDAIGCQTAIAQAITDQGADYVLTLKGNQPTLLAAVETYFRDAQARGFRSTPHDFLQTVDGDHGRVETRRSWTTIDRELLAYLDPVGAWAGLASVGMVERERRTAATTSHEVHFYLSSLDGIVAPFANAVRGQWGIENRVHWVLDIAFREDDSRVRTGHGAENFAVLRHIALKLLRQDRTTRAGVKAKRLKAGWDEAYLRSLLTA